MAVPGLEYSIYIFDGIRAGKKILHGYGGCIYLSSGKEYASESPAVTVKAPSDPVIKNPVLSIDENCAGTVEFTVLTGAQGPLYSNGSGEQGTPVEIPNATISDYLFYKQTEVAVFRKVRTATGTRETEIWNGRIGGMRKDFYNNIVIMAEGAFSYFNDFIMSGRQWKSPASTDAKTMLISIVNLFNEVETAAVTAIPTISINGKTFQQLRRRFTVGNVSANVKYDAVNIASDLEDKFEVTNGTKYYEALQNLLTRFGGHFEFVPTTGATQINWYADKEYHTHSSGSQLQPITFGINLLDYNEDLEDSEFYTVLHPIGLAEETTETESGGEMAETTETKYIDISSVNAEHPGTPYVYDNNIAQKYGFLVRMEQWNVNDVKSLYSIAKRYYKDQMIGEPVITVNAFDLKNLLNTDLSSNSYLALETLYLYDKVTVTTAFGSKTLPVVGISIPLDKFPTDTKYTITNSKIRKTALSPQNVIKRTKKDTPLPKADPGTGADVLPEDPTQYAPIAGGVAGIDAKLVHYPPIYMARDRSYIASYLQYYGEDYILQGGPPTKIDYTGGAIFYSDDIKTISSSRTTCMRDAKYGSTEKVGNWFEKVYTTNMTGSHSDDPKWDIMPYVNAIFDYYTEPEANINPMQSWAKAYSGEHLADLFLTKFNKKYVNTSISTNEEDAINQVQMGTFLLNIAQAMNELVLYNGETLQSILSAIGMTIRVDADERTLYMDMTYRPSGYGDSYTLSGKLMDTSNSLTSYYGYLPPSTNVDYYVGCVEVVNTSNASIIFASVYNCDKKLDGSPIPTGLYKYRWRNDDHVSEHISDSNCRRQLKYALAAATYVPIMIVTNATNIASGGSSTVPAVIFNRNVNTLEKNALDKYIMKYVPSSGPTLDYLPFSGSKSSLPSGCPYVYTEEILNSTSLFSVDTSGETPVISIKSVPFEMGSDGHTDAHRNPGLLTILTKHGGGYNTAVCNGVYRQIMGSNEFRHFACSSALIPAYNPSNYNSNKTIGARSESQYQGTTTYHQIASVAKTSVGYQLYYGSDMKDRKDAANKPDAYSMDVKYGSKVFPSQNYFYITPVVLGDSAYYKIGRSRIFVKV